MAGYVTYDWRKALLDATTGRTAITTATLYLGLATAVPLDPRTATLSNITEVVTAGYARKVLPAFDASVLTGGLTSSVVQAVNPNAFSFTAFSADQVTPIPYAFITSASTGTAAPIRYLFPLVETLNPLSGTPIDVPASGLILE